MTMSATKRRELMLCQQGMALEKVGQLGEACAADMMRAQIDGLINALLCIEGAEKVARFAFALSDRVCGGLREPTACEALADQNVRSPSKRGSA